MKKNPDLSKQLLERALKELPSDNSLSNVRFHLRRAINEIEKISDKRAAVNEQQKKKTPHQQWQLDLETGTLANPSAPNALGAIENLIAAEQAKIEAIKGKNKPQDQKQTTTPNTVGGLFED